MTFTNDKGIALELSPAQIVEHLKLASYLEHAVNEAVAAERERCAKIAEDLSREWWRDYKVGNGPHRADTHRQGMSDGASDVADKIREGQAL